MGAGIDGVFRFLSRSCGRKLCLDMAILFVGSILAARRLSEIMVAPCAGMIADRVGIRMPLLLCLITTIVGFALIGLDMLMAGCTDGVVVGRGTFSGVCARLSRRQIKGAGEIDLARCWRCCWTAGDRCRVGGGFTRSLHLVVAGAFTVGLLGF